LAAAAILVRTLAEINPRYPRVSKQIREQMAAARAALLEEASAIGAASDGARSLRPVPASGGSPPTAEASAGE
jgi:hypothetical protein